KPNCLRLLAQLRRLAASRTCCTAGSKSPISTATIAMTTRSSINVNADRRRCMMRFSPGQSPARLRSPGDADDGVLRGLPYFHNRVAAGTQSKDLQRLFRPRPNVGERRRGSEADGRTIARERLDQVLDRAFADFSQRGGDFGY